jgi:hypothetical protein
MAFQINPKGKNYNHGKIKFKDSRRSVINEMDQV